MNNQTYILVNEDLRSFTYLHRYLVKSHVFEGEHSLLHNRFTHDSIFLSKFLMASYGHQIVLMKSSDDRFSEIVTHYDRFLEQDIEKIVEENLYKEKEARIDSQLDRDIGGLQVSIIKMMVEKKLNDIKKDMNLEGNDAKLMMGKELALEWALHTIIDVIEKGK